jgi:hypothetical protein
MLRMIAHHLKAQPLGFRLKRQATICLLSKKAAYGYAGDRISARGDSPLLLICAVPVQQ